MKRYYSCIFCLCLVSLLAFSQEQVSIDTTISVRPLLVDQMPNAVVHQSDEIRALLDSRVNGTGSQLCEVDGFRLQIFSSNRQQQAKLEAEQMKQKLEKEIDQPIYVLSDQPFWKVRVGNFSTIEEAGAYKEVFISRFPHLQTATYVVRDKIQVKK